MTGETISGLWPSATRDAFTTTWYGTSRPNPRSTVATATEIYDYLRLLFARVGRTYCATCGREVKKDTVDEVADAILALDPETRLQAIFPLQRSGLEIPEATSKGGRSGRTKKKAATAETPALSDALRTRLFDLRKAGFNRLYQDGQLFEFSTPESLLDIDFSRPVFMLVDRLTVTPEARTRIVDAIENRNPQAASAEMANVIVNGINRLQGSIATPRGKRRTVGRLNGVRKRVQRANQT